MKLPSIRIRERKGKIVLDYVYAGRRYQRVIGPVSPETSAKAEREKTAIEVAMENGTHGATHARQEVSREQKRIETWESRTLGEFVQEYQRKHVTGPKGRPLKPESVRRANDAIGHLVAFFGEEHRMIEIRRADVLEYQADRNAVVSGGTVRRELAVLKSIVNEYIDWSGLNVGNPVRRVKVEPYRPREQRFEDEAEAQAVLERCPGILRDLAVFARNPGRPRRELVSVTWAQVKLKWHCLTLRGDQTKNGEARDVALNRTALGVLAGLERVSARVFARPTGAALDARWVSRRFAQACREANAQSMVGFHGLRHDFASRLAERGVSQDDRARLLGHSIPGVTEAYTHVRFGHLLDLVRLLDPETNPETKPETQAREAR